MATTVTGAAVSFEIWFKAASSSHGGTLISAANNGGQTKLALAMTATGTLVAAVATSAGSVSTTTAFNDNVWHLAVMTVGTSGLQLYVDNRAAVTNATVTSVANSNKKTTHRVRRPHRVEHGHVRLLPGQRRLRS